MSQVEAYLAIAAVTSAAVVTACLVIIGLERLPSVPLRIVTATGLVGYVGLCVVQPAIWQVAVVAVLTAAGLLAVQFGGGLRSRGALVTFATVAAAVDVLSFSGGLTDRILDGWRDGSNQLLAYLAVTVPLNGRLVPIVGIGDLVVAGIVFCSLRSLGAQTPIAIGVPLGGILAALVVGLAVGGVSALPFVAAAVIGYVALDRWRATGDVTSRSSIPRPSAPDSCS